MTSLDRLKAAATRLNATPVAELPRQIGFLSAAIHSSAGILQQNAAKGSDVSNVQHKLKTKIASLLQDRTQEGRFAGIVLVKSIVEAGGFSTIGEAAPWVRSLLTCLNKTDPFEVKRLVILTLTRVFLLTKDTQSYVREITTPSLPTFITSCLKSIKPVAAVKDGVSSRILGPLLHTVLYSFSELMQNFPSAFRPHLVPLRSISLDLLSDEDCPKHVHDVARNVLCLIPSCAAKNNAAGDWLQLCEQSIESVHTAGDQVFRAVIEEWTLSNPRASKFVKKGSVTSEPRIRATDALGLGPWNGISAGITRMATLLDVISRLLCTRQSTPVPLPLSNALDLTGRLCSVIPPEDRYELRSNPEIGRDERNELWLHLPRLHIAVFRFFRALTEAHGQVLLPVVQSMLTQAWDVFQGNLSSHGVRSATYLWAAELLSGRLVNTASIEGHRLDALAKHCCSDLTRTTSSNDHVSNTKDATLVRAGNGISSQSAESKKVTATGEVSMTPQSFKAARVLLPVLLCNAATVSDETRLTLDRTAVLCSHQDAMLASVLNPPPSAKGGPASSILPFFAASEGNSLSKDALLRPRMPVISTNSTTAKFKPVTEKRAAAVQDEASTNGDTRMKSSGVDNCAPLPTAVIPVASELAKASIEGLQLTAPESDCRPSTTQTRAQKRGFESMTAQTSSEATSSDIASAARPSQPAKLPKFDLAVPLEPAAKTAVNVPTSGISMGQADAESIDSSTLMLQSQIQENARVDSDTTATRTESVGDGPKAVSTQTTTTTTTKLTAQGVGQDDDDESDFEMPTIDPTMTSDEEDEEDE